MSNRKGKIWNIIASGTYSAEAKIIADSVGISEILATLLVNRGYNTVDSAKAFIGKSTEILHDPFLLNGMDKGVRRILDAVKNKEKIAIYGDYDVDGVTSVSILYLYLESLGADV